MSTEAISVAAPLPAAAPVPESEIVTAPATAQEPEPEPEPELPQIECAKPTFLHSPPDSNNAAKSDGSDSELSDLEDDVVGEQQKLEDEAKRDIGEVIPDHWSGTVPVFRPTMHQFKDFKLFMEKVDSYGMKSGIIKVIPPQEWKDNLPRLDDLVKQVRVKEPIKQEIMGSNGTYRQVNILHQRSYNLPQWRQLCEQSEHQPPARRGERRANVERPKATPRARADPSTRRTSTTTTTTPNSKKRGRGRPSKGKGKPQAANEEAAQTEERPMTPVSPKPAAEDEVKEELVESVETDPGMDMDEEDEAPRVGRMGAMRAAKPKTQSVSARRKYSRREGSAKIDEEAFRDWDYQMDVSDYTPERCEELERTYWKTLTYAPPLYGADLMGTLFDDSTDTWNLNKLPNLLDVLGTKVPGVNTAYLYLGMWKATFAWHLEDVDLYSINFLHFGAPKQWYSISQGDARRFEAAMKSIWPTDAKACDQFLRHKGFLISPAQLLSQYNIKVNKCVSYPGEFVVTYPYGYHSGYNLGYNCAEAVNFALDSWLPMGKIAKRCECAQAQDSVWIDVYGIERKMRGEETEYEETEDEEEEEDDDEELDASGLPTPPASHTVKFKTARKRKRPATEKESKKKVKKIRLRVKARVEPPCCLCPNDVPGAEILPTDDGRRAHRTCALYLPETYIDTLDDKEIVANITNIDKGRLELKCLYCRSKRGACFQCSQKKCARAYHATCAAAAGVFVEDEEVPVFGEDGTEYKEQAFEFSCRFHRTKRDKKFDGDALEDDSRIRQAAAALRKGDTCQMQYYKGDIFAGVVVENRDDEQTLLLDIIPNGDRVEVEWKWLLLPDPSDFRLQKASPNAIPMPTSRKAKDELNAKRPTDEIPRKDDPFVDGFTWAEFNACDSSNKEQAKVDLSKVDQVWHYLGKTSTEAKPQYTEDPAKQENNPKSNYLNTIPKPPKPVSAAALQRRQTYTGPPQPAPAAAVLSTTTPTAPKTSKPYAYKPRKPADPAYVSSQHVFTSQKFTPKTSPLSQQLKFGSDPLFQGLGVQYSYQRFVPKDQPRPNIPGFSPSPSPYQQAPRDWPTPSAAPRPQLPPVSLTPSYTQPQTLGSQGAFSVYQKYPFFQTHHNRDSTKYRTPYTPWGGFTNGYEGDLRAHLLQTPDAIMGNNRPNLGLGGSPSLLPNTQTSYNGPYSTGTPVSSMHNSAYGKSASPSYSPTGSFASYDASRAQYSNSASPVPGFASSQHSTSSWDSKLGHATPLHPAIRQQYGAWQGHTPPAASNQIPAVSKPQAPPKPTPPKIQYKIPDKQTPIPLPANYLAAMGKIKPAPTTPTPSQHQPLATSPLETLSATDPSPTLEPTTAPSPAQLPTPTQQAPPRVSLTPIPLPPSVQLPPLQQQQTYQAPSPALTQALVPPPPPPLPPLTTAVVAPVPPVRSSQMLPPATPPREILAFPEVPADSMALIDMMMMNLRRASENAGASG